MEDLARRIGGMVTKQAIGKYETGRMMPSPEVLERLTQVLEIAPLPPPLPFAQETEPSAPPEPSDMRVMNASPAFRREEGEHPVLKSGRLFRNLVMKRGPEDDTARNELCFSIKAVRDEGDIASLAERRARYSRAWESDSVMNRIRFREGEHLPVKTASALKYRIADYLQKCLELESILGSEVVFANPAGNMPVRTGDEVEAAAAEVRRSWDLGSGPIVNLLGLLEDRAIRVYETRGIEGFDGLSGRFGSVPFVAVGMEFPADRVRFTAAHELAHILCEFPGTESPESLCHAFAAAFLLPKAALERAFAPARRKVSVSDLGEIKEAFGISLQAIMYRVHALGLVSARQLRSFRETVKAKGWLTAEPVEYAGKERATSFRRLLHYAVAANILDMERAAGMAGVPAGELKNEIGDIF
jgi:Zn-dependent peptidase ImmA (M78 family)/transcriptional regulator with XRE-family HTH domain